MSEGVITPKNITVDCGTLGKVIRRRSQRRQPNGCGYGARLPVDTLLNHLEDTGRTIDYYDLVLTGDLGYIGKDIAADLLKDAGLSPVDVDRRYDDCGTMLYDREEQDVHGGGSGCGCSASVFCGNIVQRNAKRGAVQSPADFNRSHAVYHQSISG